MNAFKNCTKTLRSNERVWFEKKFFSFWWVACFVCIIYPFFPQSSMLVLISILCRCSKVVIYLIFFFNFLIITKWGSKFYRIMWIHWILDFYRRLGIEHKKFLKVALSGQIKFIKWDPLILYIKLYWKSRKGHANSLNSNTYTYIYIY